MYRLFFLLYPTFALADAPEVLTPGDFKISFFKTLLSMGLCLGAILVALWFVKRFANKKFFSLNNEHHIKIIERRPISPKSVLFLVQIGDKQILIAESHLEVRGICNIAQDSSGSSSPKT
jgi:flagellar biosynthetic protein FliO